MQDTKTSPLISIQEIHKAKHTLKGIADHTPLQRNAGLSQRYGANVYLKREDLQVVRSFKIRGAYNKMSRLSADDSKKGIVCASAGNHAQGVAMACSKLEIKGVIFMPTTTPQQKLDRVKHYGGGWVEIRLDGDTFDDSNATAKEFAIEHDRPFIHPFDDAEVIAGQGTVAVEVLADMNEKIDFLVVSVGGAGLISGMGSYFDVISPDTTIVAVEAEGAPSLLKAMEANKVVTLEKINGFADGIATKSVGQLPLQICQHVVDRHVLVPEGKMCVTILSLYNEEAIVVEPACASVIAALDDLRDDIQGKNVVCVLSGGNNDITRTEEIKERALLYEGKKHYFIVKFPQRSGALREFLDLLGPDDDIARFEYTKKTNRGSGPALVGIEFKDRNDLQPLLERMSNADISYQHVNNNPTLFELLV